MPGASGWTWRLARLERLGGVGHGRQRVVVDLDQLGRVLGLEPGLGHDEGHVVAHIVDLVLAQDRVLRVGAVGAVAVLHRDEAGQARIAHVGRGVDRQHAGGGLGGTQVDARGCGHGACGERST